MALSTDNLISHILDEAEFISSQVDGLTKPQYLQDEVLKRAFVRSIEIIGEAVKKLPAEFREKHPTIQWRLIAGMSDKLVHEYFGVDHEIVWDAAVNRVSDLAAALGNTDGTLEEII